MTNFLEGLVLRAAGLPPAAAPAPRSEPVFEEPGIEEIAEETAVAPVERRRPAGWPGGVPAAAPGAEDGAAPAGEDAGAPRERVVAAPAPPPLPALPAERIVETDTTREIERELVREESLLEREVIRETTVTPPPIVEREREPIHVQPLEEPDPAPPAAPEPEPEPQPQPQAPSVVLQPLIIDRTQTVIEPVREERTIIEHERETVVEPAAAETPAPPPVIAREPIHPAPPLPRREEHAERRTGFSPS
ncbi:MAG TPA: hypothetical protein VEO54_16845, partial [Thermoanaerobaculia bacterium]|nr:hypothetical protein [Thermoanaerobaculia bacterium]